MTPILASEPRLAAPGENMASSNTILEQQRAHLLGVITWAEKIRLTLGPLLEQQGHRAHFRPTSKGVTMVGLLHDQPQRGLGGHGGGVRTRRGAVRIPGLRLDRRIKVTRQALGEMVKLRNRPRRRPRVRPETTPHHPCLPPR